MAKKCPLCGGKLKDNYCDSCGYAVPEDDELSALYNLDPSDYPEPQEQPAIREITPKVQAEEIYPNRPKPPKFKVRDDEGKTVRKPDPYGQVQPPAANPYAQQQTPPPPSYYANNAGRASPPPHANTRNTSGHDWSKQFSKDIIKEFARKYWWYLALVLFCPFLAGAIITVALIANNVFEKKYVSLAIAALVLSIFLPPF